MSTQNWWVDILGNIKRTLLVLKANHILKRLTRNWLAIKGIQQSTLRSCQILKNTLYETPQVFINILCLSWSEQVQSRESWSTQGPLIFSLWISSISLLSPQIWLEFKKGWSQLSQRLWLVFHPSSVFLILNLGTNLLGDKGFEARQLHEVVWQTQRLLRLSSLLAVDGKEGSE